jgi:hypothetical protein
VPFGRIPQLFSLCHSEESVWDCALLLKVGVPSSSTVSFLKHSINTCITDPHVLSLFDRIKEQQPLHRCLRPAARARLAQCLILLSVP